MKCCLCNATTPVGLGAACTDGGWTHVEVQAASGSLYRNYCPAHDAKTCIDDVVAQWRAKDARATKRTK